MSWTRKTFHVQGTSCSNCERRIEAALGAVAGVRGAAANAPLSEVTVRYDTAAVSEETVGPAVSRDMSRKMFGKS